MSSIDSVSHTVNNTVFFPFFFSFSRLMQQIGTKKYMKRRILCSPIPSYSFRRTTKNYTPLTRRHALRSKQPIYIFIIIRTKKPYLFSINTALTFLLAIPSQHFLIRQVYKKYFNFDTGLLRIILTHQVRMNMKTKAKNQIKISS
jgi:hypothetical protein